MYHKLKDLLQNLNGLKLLKCNFTADLVRGMFRSPERGMTPFTY